MLTRFNNTWFPTCKVAFPLCHVRRRQLSFFQGSHQYGAAQRHPSSIKAYGNKLTFDDFMCAHPYQGQHDDLEANMVTPTQNVVLLHPFPFDRRYWESTATALHDHSGPTHRRVIIPDLRGFGMSSALHSHGKFTIDDMASDVVAILDNLQVDQAHIAGLSMGGYVGLALLAKHPSRVQSLVLANTSARCDSPAHRVARDNFRALVEQHGVAAFIESRLGDLLSEPDNPHLSGIVHFLGQQRPETVMQGLLALRDRPDRLETLKTSRCPVLVIAGEEDTMTPLEVHEEMANTAPDSVLHVLRDAGHLSSLEKPDAFNECLISWLDSKAT